MNDKTFQYMQSPQWLTVHNIHVDVLRHIHTHTHTEAVYNMEDITRPEDYRGLASFPD